MNHQDWQELIPFYVAQTLSPDDLQRFEAHLIGCVSCQNEIEEWRTIASAVWRQADSVAKTLPPLSRDVYSKLNRDRVSRNRYTSDTDNNADLSPNVQHLPQKKGLNLPLTLVAGTLFTFLFGGLLIMLAVRGNQTDTALDIALNATNQDISEQTGRLNATDATIAPTDIGIIPTLAPTDTPDTGAPVFATVTPAPVTPNPLLTPLPQPSETLIPPADLAAQSGLAAVVTDEPLAASPTMTPMIDLAAPLGGGPYITQVPSESVCYAFNPTSNAIEVFSQADRNSQIAGTLESGSRAVVIGQSLTGWYRLGFPDGSDAWIQSSFAYLNGDCADAIPISTVVATPTTLAPTATQIGAHEVPREATIAVVSAAFADIYTAPTFDADIIGTVVRNAQFEVLGYQGTGATRWVMVSMSDGSTAWVWASIVNEYPAGQVPPTTAP